MSNNKQQPKEVLHTQPARWILFEVTLRFSDGSKGKYISSMPEIDYDEAKRLAINNKWRFMIVEVMNIKFMEKIVEEINNTK